MNKASGGDGIPAELFQILKDDSVKVRHSACQQIWKTQQWPQDWKRSVFIPIPKKGNAKECSNYFTAAAAKLHQSCPTLCDPTDSSPPGSTVAGILQVRVLEWGAIAFSANYCTIAFISHASKIMLKIFQVRFQQYMNFQKFKLDLEKAEELEIKWPTSDGSYKKQKNFRKTSTSALLTTLKALTVWITTNCGKFLKR